jgi:hypothetical protein
MKQIEIEEHGVINVPESWEEITIKKQMLLEELTSSSNTDYKSLCVVAAYCDVTLDVVKKMKITDIKILLDSLSFISTPIVNKQVTEFNYKGDTYSVVQTLLKAETQDFISLESILDQYQGKEYKALPIIVAILAKRKKDDSTFESLSDFNIEDRAKHFEDLQITIANNIWFFFALIAKLYTIDYRTLLIQADQVMHEQINSILNTPKKSNYGGLFMHLHRVILRAYVKFLLKNWKRYYGSINLNKGR